LDPALLLLPVIVACLFALALGLALVVAIGHAYFRDVQPILAAAMVPWFFLTPIFYEPSKLPGIDRHPWAETLLTWVNPVAPFIQAVRDVLYDGRVPGAGAGRRPCGRSTTSRSGWHRARPSASSDATGRASRRSCACWPGSCPWTPGARSAAARSSRCSSSAPASGATSPVARTSTSTE